MTHGVMSNATWLASLAEALVARGISAMAIDRSGSGEASDRPGRNDADHLVSEVARGIELFASELDEVSVMGWCWGARTAILASEVARPRRLVLVAPALAPRPEVHERAMRLAQRPGDDVELPFTADDFSDEPAVRTFIRADARAWKTQPRAFLRPSQELLARAVAAVPRLGMPISVMLASDDKIVDNLAVERLFGGHEVVVARGGHALVLESPELVADFVSAALRR